MSIQCEQTNEKKKCRKVSILTKHERYVKTARIHVEIEMSLRDSEVSFALSNNKLTAHLLDVLNRISGVLPPSQAQVGNDLLLFLREKRIQNTIRQSDILFVRHSEKNVPNNLSKFGELRNISFY